MKVVRNIEVRRSIPLHVTPDSHFFFDGLAFAPRGGKWAKPLDGAMRGTVKVTCLRGRGAPRYSLRSIGDNGNGRLVHLADSAKVTVDGETRTISEFYLHAALTAERTA